MENYAKEQMGFVYEDLPEEEWEELRKKYGLNEWGGVGSVYYKLYDAEIDMLVLNLGGQNREEHPDEYVVIFHDTASTFFVYNILKGEKQKIRECHISYLGIAKEMESQKEYIRKCLVQALKVNNEVANSRFLKRNPLSEAYSIEFVFEGDK